MPSIGEILKEARNKKGISEETAARILRIKAQRVLDLEENRYDQFPALIYARGFLRQYANYLGIDTDMILQRFTEEHPTPDPKPVFEITEDQRRSSSAIQPHMPAQPSKSPLTSTGKTVLIAILIFFMIVAIAIWWVYMSQPMPAKTGLTHPETINVPDTDPPPADPSQKWEPPALPEAIPAVSLWLTNSLPSESGFNP